jgi:heme-degrading monooxygenase HmoA
MTVKIIIDRKFKEAPQAEDIRTLNDLRIRAMGQEGYISGETLVETDDFKKVVVLSVWSNIDDWDIWVHSRERQVLEAKLTPKLEHTPNIRSFMSGADSLREILSQVVHDSDVAET